MTLITRIEGPVITNQLVSSLTAAVTRTLPLLNRRRALKREQDFERELRQMQEDAYTNSLAQDRARVEEERRRASESERIAREQLQNKRLVEESQHKRDQWRQWKAADLKSKGLVGMKGEIGKTARVGLRLVGGERIVQVFPGDIALAEVYCFVECYDLLFPQTTGVTLRSASDTTVVDADKPDDYEHEFMFRLVVPYPRKVIDSGFTRVKDEAALWPSGSIVVEEIEDDSSSSDSE
jgi:FAS-associated factor 2